MTPDPQPRPSAYTHCECGRRIKTSHLAHHRRHSCPKVQRDGHCAYCLQPAVGAILAKLRSGMVPEAVAESLDVQTEYVIQARARARAHGCVSPGPKKGTPEYEAEREARARFVMKERACIECKKTYTPVFGSTHQGVCSFECRMTRRNRLRRKGDPRMVKRPIKNTVAEGKEERAMVPLEDRQAFIKAEADRLGAIIEANREHSFRLSMSLFGVEI